MQIRKTIIGGLIIIIISTFHATSLAAGQQGDWFLREKSDEMDGSVKKFIVTYSKEALEGRPYGGRLQNEVIVMGYSCSPNKIYLKASSMGFAIDNVDCGTYGCDNIQYGRVKFDDGPTDKVKFRVWGNYSMTVNSDWTQSMKKGSAVKVELELLGTKDLQQIATFSLNGFTAAYNWCNR